MAVRPLPMEPRRGTSPVLRRRRWTEAGLGLFLVVVCGVGIAKVAQGLSNTTSVLAVAREVPQGHVLEAGDLRDVDVRLDGGASSIAASDESSVVGETAAVPLFPGDLLTRSQLGAGTRLAPGEVLDPVLLKPGQYPPDLRTGAQVVVIVGAAPGAPSSGTIPSGAGPMTATVRGIDRGSPSSASQTTTVTLEVPLDAATRIAAAGSVTLAELPPTG